MKKWLKILGGGGITDKVGSLRRNRYRIAKNNFCKFHEHRDHVYFVNHCIPKMVPGKW